MDEPAGVTSDARVPIDDAPEHPDQDAKPTPAEPPPAVLVVSLRDEHSPESIELPVSWSLAGVLARAALVNGKRGGFDLSFSSLLLGILTGRDATCRWVAEYFSTHDVSHGTLCDRVGKKWDEVVVHAGRADEGTQEVLKNSLLRTSSARQALDMARSIAEGQGVSAPAPLELRYLIAALIFLRDYHDRDFQGLGIDRPEWGAAFVAHLDSAQPQEQAFWRRYYERSFHRPLDPVAVGAPALRADFDADAYTRDDLLDIEDEVRALAYVIASTATQPPLSIGLFGDWGAGKTFFMKHLRGRVERLTKRARDEPGAPAYHRHVVQIEFNAWHYQESDLWASLVDHILRNLRFGEDDGEVELRERRDALLEDLEAKETLFQRASERTRRLEKREEEAREKVEQLERQQREHQEKLARELAPADVLRAVEAGLEVDGEQRRQAEALLESLGVGKLARGAGELRRALDDARRELGSLSALLVPLLSGERRRRRMAALTLVVLVPVALAAGVHELLADDELRAKLGSAVSGVLGFVAAAAAWVHRQLAWLRTKRAELEPVARAIEESLSQQVEARSLAQGRKIADEMARLAELGQERAAAVENRQRAAAEVEALRAGVASTEPDARLLGFLDERLRAGDYNRRLGLAALIRRDFEWISRRIEEANRRTPAAPCSGKLVINRIVLYVDDLDRCSEERVVEVLRAVHLLLAFPAFVVVVGVDSRWVAHCLQKYFPAFLKPDDGVDGRAGVLAASLPDSHATPLDYLEKIFQIPIWLEPMSAELRVEMARKLMDKEAPVEQRHAANAAASGTSGSAARPHDDAPASFADSGADTPAARAASDGSGSGRSASARDPTPDEAPAPTPDSPAVRDPESEPPIDLNPAALRISEHELEFVERLGPLLSPSPRVLKRFVNTYRLFKATQPQSYFEPSLPGPSDPELCLLLLAIFIGMPELSRALQRAVVKGASKLAPSANPGGGAGEQAEVRLGAVVQGIRHDTGTAGGEGRATRDGVRLVHWLDAQGFAALPLSRLAPWLPRVGRYTFNLSR